MASQVTFPLDSGVVVKLPHHRHSSLFPYVTFKEPLLRAIANHLIANEIIPKGSGIIDLGSWIGDNALPWSMSFPGIVYAIDPSDENIAFIKSVSVLNGITNIVAIQAAVSDSEESLGTLGDPTHCCLQPVDQHSENSDLSLVTISTTLDLLHQEGVIGEVGFMHLDVEGYEMKVLLGAQQMIEKYKPVVMFESHVLSQPTIPMINFLADLGYKVFMINETHPGANPDCRNFVAFHGDNNETNSIIRTIIEVINPVEVHYYHPAYESLQSLIPTELFLVGDNGVFLPKPIFA
jgi:FkbM family methyltransferase